MEFYEVIGVVGLGAATLLPLILAASRMTWLARLGLTAMVLTLMGCVLWASQSWERPLSEQQITHRPIQTPDEGYVGSDSCRSCHPRYHATWDGSYHSKMTQTANAQSIMGVFDDVQLRRGEYVYALSRDDERYFVRIKKHGADWGERREVVMTTGSHHRQWVWFETGDSRKIFPLPFIYLKKQQRWVPKESGFLIPPERKLGMTNGEWNKNCIQCHTTQGRPLEKRLTSKTQSKDATSMDTRVGEFGISCESCHGPGEEHVKANQSPTRRHHYRTSDEHDPTIKNPENLSAELSSHICGQCHSAMSSFKISSDPTKNRETHDKWNREGFPFRPGDDLRDTRYLFGYEPHMQAPAIRRHLSKEPNYMADRFWSDGVIRIAGREFSGLLQTPCYNHGDESKQMSCLSCHAMHQPYEDSRAFSEWADDQLKPSLVGAGLIQNKACTQCHEDFAAEERLVAHTHHAADSDASLCYNCHMPHTTFGLLKAIRSHGLVSPSVASTVETGRPNACNLCHMDRTLAWTATHLEDWYQQDVPELEQDQANVAAGVLWTLKGDAGQRGLIAWSMGWKPAQKAAGTDWMTPYLVELLKDRYDAVRFVANETLQSLDGFAEPAAQYDFLADKSERDQIADSILELWKSQLRNLQQQHRTELLLDQAGQIQSQPYQRMLGERDERPVSLME